MDIPQHKDDILYPLSHIIETIKVLEKMIENDSKPKHIKHKLGELDERVERLKKRIGDHYKF